METEPTEFIPTRATLLQRLKDRDDHASWKEFCDIYWKLIYSTALKAGLTETEAEDVVQETLASVARHMPEFRYDPTIGSFKTWLLRLTGWRITDQLRKRQHNPKNVHCRRADTTRTSTIERIPDPNGFDPAAFWDEEWEKNLMDVAIERVKRKVDPKQYQLFDLYVLQQWPPKKIARLLRVSVGRVYLTKHRISGLIRKEVACLKKQASWPVRNKPTMGCA